MSALVQRINFEPVTDVIKIDRRDFALADPTLAQPLNATALTDGEWMVLNASYQLVRASTIGTPGNRAAIRAKPLWAERGRYDVQAMADVKVPVFFSGFYEIDTRIFDAAVALGGGAAITFVGQWLKVATITLAQAIVLGGGSRNFTGLVGHGGAADTDPVVGEVTRLPSANGGKLRFQMAFRS